MIHVVNDFINDEHINSYFQAESRKMQHRSVHLILYIFKKWAAHREILIKVCCFDLVAVFTYFFNSACCMLDIDDHFNSSLDVTFVLQKMHRSPLGFQQLCAAVNGSVCSTHLFPLIVT